MKNYLRTFISCESAVQAVKVGIIGVFNTIVSFSFFNVFLAVGALWFWSITVSFAITTFLSYFLDHRWTFELKDGRVSMRETTLFFGVNIAAYFALVGLMWLAKTLFGLLLTIGYSVALLFAVGLLILPKLARYRDIVFGDALDNAVKPKPIEA